MNRRQFLTASVVTSAFGLLFARRDTAAEYAPKPPPPPNGWCLEYISPPETDEQQHTVHLPITTNDD